MKFRKILCAAAACAVAATAISVSSFASVFECKLSDGGNGGPALYMFPSEETMGVKIDDIESVKFYTVSTTDYFKGVIGGNVGGAWTVTPEKEFDLSAGVTEIKDIPDFENDGSMQFQCWWMNAGSTEFTKVEMLDKSGKVLYTDGAAAADTKTEDTKTEDTKTEAKTETVTAKMAYTDGTTPSFTYKLGTGAKELKVKVAMTGNVEWNDWCGAGVAVTAADGTKSYYQWGGAQVSWGWDATGDKVDDSVDGVNGKTWIGTVGATGGEITVPVSDNATVEFYCLSWDSKAGVDQYTLTFDAPVAADAAETPADPVDEPTTPAEETEPAEETIDESSEESEESYESSEESEESYESEETESFVETDTAEETETASEPAAPAEDTTNTGADKGSPDTGVAGVAGIAGVAVLAGAAVVVARKRK